ncbi:hypothetical protein LEP1GSC145_1196 [Leptospira interrogans serovar Djasiman str. LT1649]|nr:hypothetical protein LEP1GSC145_1196 [Leptospira interrogans serovar Djasiman str. LT1649]
MWINGLLDCSFHNLILVSSTFRVLFMFNGTSVKFKKNSCSIKILRKTGVLR